MGSLNALGMAEAVNDGMADIKVALSWHLQANHYPPVHQVFLPTALEAIEAAKDEDWDRIIVMPNGISKSVGSIVEELHLDAFLVDFDEDAEVDEDGNFIDE